MGYFTQWQGVCAAVAVFVGGGAAAQEQGTTGTTPFDWRPVTITATENGAATAKNFTTGKLRYRGGLTLNSDDSGFGGFSALRLTADQTTMIALSDRAQWLTATIRLSADGAIVALENAQMSAMMGADNNTLSGKGGDAEALALTTKGVLVGFERDHRLDHYVPDERGRYVYDTRILHDRQLRVLQPNKSLESVVLLSDGRILTIAEGPALMEDTQGTLEGILTGRERPGWMSSSDSWTNDEEKWVRFAYLPAEEFSVTDIAEDPATGELYVLERAFSRAKGVRARLTRIAADALTPNAVWLGEELARLSMLEGIDNMEGLALARRDDGQLMAYILSDDNFSRTQRTVLQSWEVTDRPGTHAGDE